MVNVKKLLFALIAFIFIISMNSSVFASQNIVINTNGINTNTVNNSTNSTGTTSLEVVENKVCTIDVDEYGRFEKKITSYDEKSVTLSLSFTNIKEIEESKKDVEIFLVIDNSSSMTENSVEGKTRKQVVIDSANSLVDKLYAANPNAKIGIVGFSSLDSTAGETEGTIEDAELRLELSNSKEDVKSAITNLAELKAGPRTNIEAGLTIAQDNFSSEENIERYVVLLTDGVPNNATDGTFATYSGKVATRTKAKIEEIEDSGINIIATMINLDTETVEPSTGKTYRALAEEIFGTVETPTTSKYYNIPDSEMEDTIVNDIYNDLVVRTDNTLKNIVIKDYFPQDIIDNFNFEYVASPNVGNVSQKVDTTDNSITWNIELLSEGETASLSYKLTLKDNYNKEIIDKILPTNEKVDITAENNNNKFEETSNVSPTVRVRYQKPVDNTVANTVIPQTGENSTGLVTAIISIIAIVVIARIIYIRKYSDK